MKLKLLFIVFFTALPSWLYCQREFAIEGMKFSYVLDKEEIEIQLTAPTKGWLGIGFNDQNSIAGSDLYLLRVQQAIVEGLDLFVVAFGNPQEDAKLDGSNDLKIISGEETETSTTVKFRLPFPSQDQYDFQHKVEEDFWLILAYSVSDDFDHHSIMRKHIPFKFSK